MNAHSISNLILSALNGEADAVLRLIIYSVLLLVVLAFVIRAYKNKKTALKVLFFVAVLTLAFCYYQSPDITTARLDNISNWIAMKWAAFFE